MDRWDLVGAAGVALVAVGIERLASWPWAAIFVGCVLGALYALRELGVAALLARRNGS